MRRPLNFHDNNLLAVQVNPPRRRGEHATISIELQDYSGLTKRLTFSGCANIRWGMDFNVLAHNWYGQTDHFTVLDDTEKLLSFVEGQRRLWGVRYMESRSPIRQKVETITRYQLFKLKFFGGTLEVLAKHMKVSKISAKSQ